MTMISVFVKAKNNEQQAEYYKIIFEKYLCLWIKYNIDSIRFKNMIWSVRMILSRSPRDSRHGLPLRKDAAMKKISLSILALGLGFVAVEPVLLSASADAQTRPLVQQPTRFAQPPRGLAQPPARIAVQPQRGLTNRAGIVAGGAGNLRGNGMVAAGGGNLRGNGIVAAGGGNLRGNGIVAAGGGNLRGNGIVAAGGGNLRPR